MVVSRLTPPPPARMQALIEHVRYPGTAASAELDELYADEYAGAGHH